MLRLLLLVTTQTQALRMPLQPLRITHVHRAVAAPTTPTTADARPNALLFPVLTVAAAALGRAAPQTVAASLGTKAAFRRGLALLMVSMGLTLTPSDLKRASQSPRALAVNAVCCFGIAPLASLACAAALGLEADARAGLLLLGCVSGGQASNLCTLLGGGDAALSVVLTTSTTLLGCLATPWLASRLLRSTVAVDGVRAPRPLATAWWWPSVASTVWWCVRVFLETHLSSRRRRSSRARHPSSWRRSARAC